MPDFNYSDDIITIFNRLLEKNSNEKIKDFVKENEKIKDFVKKFIGIEKYSFHQINIFIKLFTSQFSKFQSKFTFNQIDKDGKEEDITKKRITEFAKCTRYFTNGGFAELLTNESENYKEYTNFIDKLSAAYKDDLSKINFNTPLIFLNYEKRKVHPLYIPGKDSKEYKNSKDYLKRIKEILDIPNEVDKDKGELKSLISILEEKNKNYVITNDNFRKIILLVYRIRANVPVIIMGDTGCGKTMLITKLNQLLNNGLNTVETIDIHPGINDEKLCNIMDKKDSIARQKKDKELWLFFDEINTCLSLSLITEIFINRTYGGKKISDNIRLIGACNPYRKRKGNKEKCGLSIIEDNDDELVYLVQPLPQSLLYYVFSFGSINEIDEKKYIKSIIEKLFDEEEKDLHEFTTETIFLCHAYLRNEFDDSVVSLREINRFNKCVQFFIDYFEKKNNYLGLVNNKQNNKLRSIICSIYLCYYIRLIDDNKRNQRNKFENEIRATLLKLVNSKDEKSKLEELNKIIRKDEGDKEDNNSKSIYEKKIIEDILNTNLTEEEIKMTRLEKDLNKDEINKVELINLSEEEKKIATQKLKSDGNNLKENELEILNENKLRYFKELKLKYKKYYENVEEKTGSFISNFKNKALKNEIQSRPNENIKFFSNFIKIEQDFLIEQIELGEGIGKNTLLKENIFLLFVSLNTNIPLIIIGKPGCGKSLSSQLITESMKGKYSNNKFFQLYPRIIQTYFQGSQSTIPDDVECLFERAVKKLEYYKKKKESEKNLELPISMVLFDELGLAEASESNPLKVLHSRLDYTGKDEGVSFVGISNYTLDAAKVNRALVLSVPDLDKRKDEIIKTASNIVESISNNIKDDKIFQILSNTYFEYKQQLKIIKELVVFKKYVNKYVPKEPGNNEKDKNIDNNIPNNSQINYKKSVTSDSSPQENEIKNNTTKNEASKKDEEAKKKEKLKEIKDRQFVDIAGEKLYKDLMKKEKKIKVDFHGNRDFYNLIKGTAYELGKSTESTDEDKVNIIIKYIERNFGGIDYEVDIDFSIVLRDIDKKVKLLEKIFKEYKLFDPENTKTKLKSVYLFKALYNLQFDEKDTSLRISPDKINDYNLNNCINENIWDNNSRYLLLEIDKTLTTLIFKNIKLQNILKPFIKLLDGSRFPDDNNKAYRFMKLNQIQEDAKQDGLILIENLNQIHPFLFDLYNRNFQIVNGKKFARISLDNFDEQLTEVNDGFRIIILVDKAFVNKCNLAFLNRLEKMNLSFIELLDSNLKIISNKLIAEFNLQKTIENSGDVNYSLEELLINCKDDEIRGLIYHFSIETHKEGNDSDNEDEQEEKIDIDGLREKVIDKIYKILPQDIIAYLPKKNKIRTKYIEKKSIYNFNDYMAEEYKKYKISIIYTYTNRVDGLNNNMSFMISEIRSEGGLKILIEEIKDKSKNEEKKYICIHFEQSNSEHIKFVSNFILTNFENDDFNYLIMVHINRNFNKQVKEKIYSLPDIDPKINQIFIDNLNSNNEIKLTDILSNDIQKIFQNNKDKLKLDEEFNKTLITFLKTEIKDNNYKVDKDKYINDMKEFMENEKSIKNKIMELTYRAIDNDMENEENNIVDKIFKEKMINNFTVDITSCLIEFIKENIFNRKLKNIFQMLEDNNILTTILEKALENQTVEEIINDYLIELINEKKEKYNCKFLYNYNVPGLYNFYDNISNYIKKNIISNYFVNEEDLRKSLVNDPKLIIQFHKKEDSLLQKVCDEIDKNHKLIFKIIDLLKDNINDDLIFKDYITFYLEKYNNIKENNYKKDDIYHKIIIKLLELRFNSENRIIKSSDTKKILLIKIIWLESNVNYILNIINILYNAKDIFNNDIELYNKIEEEIYQDNNIIINYITNEKRNPEITKEVNQCFYILLAGICLCITSDYVKIIQYKDDNDNNGIQITINHYCYKLKEINKIMQTLSDDLYIFLNEMFIIDELIKVIEIFQSKINIDKIQKIKKELRENANIIQYNHNNKDKFKFSSELRDNFDIIYDLITKNGEIYKKDKNYYNNLRYILLSEIIKIADIDYRSRILEKLLEDNEMIKKSNDIFQIILKQYLKKKDKFKENKENILKGKDNIIKLIEDNLDKKIVLEETILYLFEKNSLIYYEYILNSKKDFDDEPLELLKEFINYLNDYNKNSVKKEENSKILKLFCLGYIKTYCFTFIKMFTEKNPNWQKSMNIIKAVNGENAISKMIRLFIYKILYNKFSVNFFYNEENIKKYELKNYTDYKQFIKNKDLNNVFKINFKVKTLNVDFYEESCEAINDCKKNDFNNKIDKKKFDVERYGIDNFYMAVYNSTLSYLQIENTNINKNFYDNICQPLFDGKLLKALSLLFNTKIYNDISQKYNINSTNIKPFIFGFRFCLNELSIKKQNGIYYSLYDEKNINFLKEKLYPGNDTKFNLVYSQIINHFRYKPKAGCYICLCQKMFYHCVESGFPGVNELPLFCPNCNKNIGSYKDGDEIKIFKKDYYRILKDDEEAKELKNNENTKDLMKEINYMSLKYFTDNYITKYFKNEKGILITTQDNFKNANKVIRNLNQVSYRLLNYILYIHLFFAKLITNKDDFDNYLPKDMSWVETISECWNLLKVELLENKIDSIEEFMYYIFPELFPILNEKTSITKYDDLITFENLLESKIQTLLEEFRKNPNIFNSNDKSKNDDKNSTINLLNEIYTSEYYNEEEYPFYKYFYYTEYIDESYIIEKLSHKDVNQYPILKLYLESINKENKDNNKNILNKLDLFNNTLNIISQKYFNNIPRESANKKILKKDEIYDKKKFEEFIEFYNNLKLKEIKSKPKLSNENHLCDFFVDNNNKYGKTYIEIYKVFIKQQNEILEKLLINKIERGIFDNNCKNKINIQQINKKEIFDLNLPKKVSFIDILFNSSYRKVLDNLPINYRSYKEYYINYDLLEEIMTDLLLRNKKLLNEDITEFIYNNEVFNNEITDLISSFKLNYDSKELKLITIDKVPIYKFCNKNNDNTQLYKEIIKDFIELLEYLINLKKEQNNVIEESLKEKKLYEIVDKIKDTTSKNFIQLFDKNDTLTVNKTAAIFEFFLKLIFDYIIVEINDFQDDNDIDDITKGKINDYFNENHLINKKDFSYAIRLFTTLVLFQETDKENRIKTNHINILNYLNPTSLDLWKYDSNDNKFMNDFNILKSINVPINQIISLYKYLGGDFDDNYFDDVKQKIKSEDAPKVEEVDDDENKDANEEQEEKEESEVNDEDDDRT